MFEKKIHTLECRNEFDISDISDLRAKYLIPNDIYMATIDMSNDANSMLHSALVIQFKVQH
ncbi:MAG: hypothetical protein CUN55_16665 [Phototrophicales bacterium]|nr:MAG: hypothetical protein CUN55_16665 [Phototrophicales bacterium]